MAIPLLVALALGSPAHGAAAAVGAMSAGFASQQGVYRTRAAAMLLTAGGMGVSAFVGGIAGQSPVGLVIATMAWGYAYGIIASLGPSATAAAINSAIALIVFGHFRISPSEALIQGTVVFLGGATQTMLLVLVWPLRRFSAERHALARAFRSLAQYARGVSGELRLPEAAPLAAVRATLADPQPFARRGEIGVFVGLIDEAERIRGSLATLSTDRNRAALSGAAGGTIAIDDALLRETAAVLDEVAAALDDARAPRGKEGLVFLERLADQLDRVPHPLGGHAQEAAIALAGQLRSVWRLAAFPAGGDDLQLDGRPATASRAQRAVVPILTDALTTLRANLSLRSVFGRLGVRLALALGVAAALGEASGNVHGYWVPLTTLIVLRPDFTTTFARGFARVGGTVVGAALSTALAFELRPSPDTYVLSCIVFASLGYVVFNANYGLFSVAITAYVVFALSLLGQPEASAIVDRIVATLGGGVIAAIAYVAWPLWESGLAPTRLAELLEAQRRYALAVLAGYGDPGRRDLRAIRDGQTAAWAARAEAEASVDRMLGEPGRTHELAGDVVLGVLAASRRFGLGTLGLYTTLARAEARAHPELDALCDALGAGLAACARALRDAGPPPAYPSLRDAYRRAEETLRPAARGGSPDADAILVELDVMVDSLNTLADDLRRAFLAPS